MEATAGKSQQTKGFEKMSSSDRDGLSVIVTGTISKSDTPLTQCGSLDVLWRHLIRLRPSCSWEAQQHVSNLIEQCKNYERGNKYLARRMLETMDRIRPATAPYADR